jgi:hypothetical protein
MVLGVSLQELSYDFCSCVQYLFMLKVQNQLSIDPAVNLGTNIGLYSAEVTYTVSKKAMKSYVFLKRLLSR